MSFQYLVLPWSLLCWAVALLVWALRAASGHARAGEFPRRVLRAPVDLPRRVQRMVRRWRRRMNGPADRRIADRAMRELVSELEREGFTVRVAMVTIGGYVRVHAIVSEHREDEFGAVCDRVHRRFADIDMEKFFSEVEPCHALDARWARMHGKSDHFCLAFTAPCYACKKQEPLSYVFGTEEASRILKESHESAAVYVTEKGGRVVVYGHLCDPCRTRAKLIMVSGIAVTDHEPDEGDGTF